MLLLTFVYNRLDNNPLKPMAYDLIGLIKKYRGKWIAMKPGTNTVISSGRVAKKVFMEAKEKGVGIPTLFKVPTEYTPYIG